MANCNGVRTLILLIATLLIAACSKTNPHPHDPLEGFNREVYGFNRALDKGLIRPVAYLYYKYTPPIMQTGVHNFFNNLDTLPTIANDILQLKIAYAVHDSSRFLINSTIGVFGLFNVAQELGLDYREEDFGQTLLYWGYKNSTYLVLPILGPSTIRDGAGMIVDLGFSVWPYVHSEPLVYSLKGLELIDIRAKLLRNETVLESIGVDEYAFVRNAYLQRRMFRAYDGQVPKELQTDPFEDEDWLDQDDEDLAVEETSEDNLEEELDEEEADTQEPEQTADDSSDVKGESLDDENVENSSNADSDETSEMDSEEEGETLDDEVEESSESKVLE